MPVTNLFEADIKLFELLDHKKVFTKGYTCMIHCHTILEECVIRDVISLQVKDHRTGIKKTKDAPKFVKS
jgi:peptide chain release factor subunit 3